MKVTLLVVFALFAFCAFAEATTVREAIRTHCDTSVCSGLSRQLVEQLNCLRSGLFSNLNNLRGVRLSSAAAAVPYLQTSAANSLQRVINSRGATMTINSGLRTLAQQLMLYTWGQQGRCGIKVVAAPGRSNHNGGLAVDIEDNAGWRSYMLNNGWTWQGSSDPMHYNYAGSDIRELSVRAFQRLWNQNHPNPSQQLKEDGIYGPATEKAILDSPVGGFSRNYC